jgi:hypothetical protein
MASRGHAHDADALFFTKLALAHREGGLPLFTELPGGRGFWIRVKC